MRPCGRAAWLGALKKDTAQCEKIVFNPSACRVNAALGADNVAEQHIQWARDGFKLTKATCTGSGRPDSTGYRFTAFRCLTSVVTIISSGDPDYPDTRLTSSGRLAIWPTGRATLRWKLI